VAAVRNPVSRREKIMAKKTQAKKIVLIGMCAAGKTKVGRRLAKRLGYDFVDIDDRIKDARKADSLEAVVHSISAREFTRLENDVAKATLNGLKRPTVIATGGSMIYCPKAMSALSEDALVIHLRASRKTIERRVKRRPDRGIVMTPGETIAYLYRRRMPLYALWAQKTVCTDGNRAKVAKRLAKRLREKGY
jgi:shikimate kinase